MALDRQSIARRGFATVRRGYDPAAVDAHLAAIADEVEELRRRAGREHVARVAEAADGLRARIEALESELTGVFAALRAGADRLRADLDEAAADAARVAGAGGGAVPDGVAPSAVGATLGSIPHSVDGDEVGEEPALEAVAEAPAAPDRSRDVEGARIVALERALSGVPREETDRLLAEQYDLSDRAAGVDEAYRVASQA